MKPKNKVLANDLENLINQKPPWFIRYGLLLFLIIVTACLVGMKFVNHTMGTRGNLLEENGQVLLQMPVAEAENLKLGQMVTVHFGVSDSLIITGTAAFRKQSAKPQTMMVGLSHVKPKSLSDHSIPGLQAVDIFYASDLFHVIFERWKGRYRF
jgi:hypothetical protein